MTDTMQYLYRDLEIALFNCYPEEYIDFCFESSFPENILSFVDYMIFELLEKHSIRFFIPYSATDDNNSERSSGRKGSRLY